MSGIALLFPAACLAYNLPTADVAARTPPRARRIVSIAEPPLEVSPMAARGGGPPDGPPPRSETVPGYVAPPELVTWKPFRYSTPQARRDKVREYTSKLAPLPPLPPLHIVLIGGVAAGKGTIAPMLSQAFRARVVGIGALLRAEARTERPRGRQAARAMAEGELLPNSVVVELLEERLCGDGAQDIARNGWLLDGFPRTRLQAEALLTERRASLRPDAVVLIERPDELVKEFALGRCTDARTGQTYHPVYAPPPEELYDQLVWRVDDTYEALERRLADHKASIDGIVAAFEAGGVPVRRFDNARSELETFGEISSFLKELSMDLLAKARDELVARRRGQDAQTAWGGAFPRPGMIDATDGPRFNVEAAYASTYAYGGPAYQKGELPSPTALLEVVAREMEAVPPEADANDVEVMCDPNETEGDCVVRYREEREIEEVATGGSVGALLAAVRRCNSYDSSDFVPVLLGDDDAQVGWLSSRTLEALAPQLAVGATCELVDLCMLDEALSINDARERCGACVRLAPHAMSAQQATETIAAMVDDLVADGLIPRAKVRNELQDVHPLSRGFVPPSAGVEPCLRLERAAMIYFGVPSYGIHVNGWVRDPDAPDDPTPHAMWVAKRSLSKATYAGLLDQMVAGGQPSRMDFADNVRKECEEEASLPPHVIDNVTPTGAVSYRYATAKGLSSKTLATYDVEMPHGLVPLCSDGEVEEFRLVPVGEVLRSLREDLPLWKPNSALVAIDFCVRHGLIEPSEPGYLETVALLRVGRGSIV